MKKSPLPVQTICEPEKQKIGEETPVKLLRWHFGHSEFRGKQLEAIETVLSVLNDEEQFSEFWDRDEEASGSDASGSDDISDAADIDDVAKSMVCSSFKSKSRLSDRTESLQRAEESYYRNKAPDKQINKIDKNATSETLRESGKQRLLNVVKQNQQRFTDLQFDYEACALMLENERYNQYGKSGKSFYLSQLASTMRWISTETSEELANRLNITSPVCNATTSTKLDNLSMEQSALNGVSTAVNDEKSNNSVRYKTPAEALPCVSEDMKLPPIPSFSDFINS